MIDSRRPMFTYWRHNFVFSIDRRSHTSNHVSPWRQGNSSKHPCLCVLFVGGLTVTERQSVSINIYHSELQVRDIVSREQL